MKVVLLDNVKGIGRVGEVKDVSDGYARNYLIPRGIGKPVTEGILKDVQGLKAKKLEALSLARAQSEQLVAKLAGVVVVLHRKANKKGTLFSGITESDVADALSKIAEAHIPSTAVVFDGHIKALGVHEVRIQLADDLVANVNLDIQDIA
jgi:large subunit ribosomal protein L9